MKNNCCFKIRQLEQDLRIERANLARITLEWEELLHKQNVFNKLPWYKRIWRVLRKYLLLT